MTEHVESPLRQARAPHAPSLPFDAARCFALTVTQAHAVKAIATAGKLYKFCHVYGVHPVGEVFQEKTIASLIRLNLVGLHMGRERHFFVTLTAMGRLVAQGLKSPARTERTTP